MAFEVINPPFPGVDLKRQVQQYFPVRTGETAFPILPQLFKRVLSRC